VCLAQTDRIPALIDSSQMVTLAHSVHAKARPQYDQGPVEPSLQMGYVTLQIGLSPSQQVALNQLLEEQQDRSSPNYHKWLTPEQYAARFGLSRNDANKIATWLESQGLTLVQIARGRNAVIFGGSAAQIQGAFRTEIHRYEVDGEKHVANSIPVQVPAAFSGVISGIRGLNDFKPKPMYARPAGGRDKSGPHPSYTTSIQGTAEYFLAPGDLATIYDINPLYSATPTAINGAGQKLAIMGQTDIYLADLVDFRSGFGLPSFTCTTGATGLITSCPNTDTSYLQYVLLGIDPLSPSVGDLFEADLDVEWSGAIAPNAQIIFVNAQTTNGVFDALTYAIDNAIAPVISMSYGVCEGALSLEEELLQGNAEGITIMNSAGDTGSAACDNQPPSPGTVPFTPAENGLAVSYPASSPEVTAVGGTSVPQGDYTPSFWGPSNGATGGSALTSLEGQEVSWNDDVAFASFCTSNPSNQFCTQGGTTATAGWVPITSSQAAQEDLWISAGGGGVSNCFTTDTNGICLSGFARPPWQSAIVIPGLTSPQSTYRYVPDVSLMASPNFPGYILCTPQEEVVSGSTSSTSSCVSGIPTAVDTYFSLVGGTSASTPVFAGIVTLINQYLGSSGLGNINPTLYSLAATPLNDYFHHINSGENDAYCVAGDPTLQPADVICPKAGVFGFSATNADSGTGNTGYNLVTGLGSVDANNLATAWKKLQTNATSIALTGPTITSVYEGASVSFTVAVTPTTALGGVSFSTLVTGSTTPVSLGSVQLNIPPAGSGTATFITTALPAGTNTVTATYDGDTSHTSSVSPTPAVVNVTIPFTMNASPTALSVPAGQTATSVITLTPTTGFTGTVNFTNSIVSSPGVISNPGSCTAGLPAGAACSFSPSSVALDGVPADVKTVTLTITTVANMAPSGAQAISVTGTSTGASITSAVSLTVSATNQSVTLTPTNGKTFSVAPGGTAAVSITVAGANGFIVGSGTSATTALPLTYTCSGSPSLSTALISCQAPNNGQPTSAAAVTVSLVTTGPTAQLRPPVGRASRIFYALLLPGLFGIFFLPGSRRRGVRLLGLIVVLGVSTLGLGACGGGGSSNSSQNNPGTPAGNYSVTVTATTGAPIGGTPITSTTTFTLTVN